MNRARRRALLDAHWSWTMTEQRSCDECSVDLDGEGYQGVTLAANGKLCCRSCAIELVDDTDARPTMEMEPVTNEHANAQLRLGIHRDAELKIA